MITHYIEHTQLCEGCNTTIGHNEEVVLYDNLLFCESYCLRDYLLDVTDYKRVVTTTDRRLR